MSAPTDPAGEERRGSLSRLQLVMGTSDSELSPDEIARLIQVAALEPLVVDDMDACWERLRASHRARERLQHLTPSEVHEAIARSRQSPGEDGDR
jgi:hypothetical protein